jgi:hypothetical protein
MALAVAVSVADGTGVPGIAGVAGVSGAAWQECVPLRALIVAVVKKIAKDINDKIDR